jgi:hypothetical protein
MNFFDQPLPEIPVSSPSLLPLADRQTLEYKYVYLEESIERLAQQYKITSVALTNWFKENKIERKVLKTVDDYAEFESYVAELKSSLQTKLSGLVALNSAVAWQSLASSEEYIMNSLVRAAKLLDSAETPNSREIATLASIHLKMIEKHELIAKRASTNVDPTASSQNFNWELEVTHVNKDVDQKAVDDGTDQD